MDAQALLKQIDRLIAATETAKDGDHVYGVQAQICDFLRKFSGKDSSFLQTATDANGSNTWKAAILLATLKNYREYVEAGLASDISIQRQAQLDVVSDFLEQAHHLLNSKSVHPAAPIVLIGATLEEFLRTWVESANISLEQRKPSIDAYGQALHAKSLISKQDLKDLVAWAGLRNHAAHGEWGEVEDRTRAAIMLEGVNLFMRKYSAT